MSSHRSIRLAKKKLKIKEPSSSTEDDRTIDALVNTPRVARAQFERNQNPSGPTASYLHGQNYADQQPSAFKLQPLESSTSSKHLGPYLNQPMHLDPNLPATSLELESPEPDTTKI